MAFEGPAVRPLPVFSFMATPAALAAWASEARGGYSPKKEVVDALVQLLDAGD